MKKTFRSVVLGIIVGLGLTTVLAGIAVLAKPKCAKAAQFDIPEKPAGMEELAPCIDVTSNVRNPIELVRENQTMFIANAD